MSRDHLFKRLEKYFCPPGDGVYTLSAARDLKSAYQNALFPGCLSHHDIQKAWLKQLRENLSDDSLVLLGICSDMGGGILRGANWGPLYLREGLRRFHPDLAFLDLGDVRVIPQLLLDEYCSPKILKTSRKALYPKGGAGLPVSPLSIAYDAVSRLLKSTPGARPFTLGGDHSVSYPVVKAYLEAKKAQNIRVGLLHFDAHTDLLDSRLGIPVTFGSWTTHILKLFGKNPRVWQVGIRATGKSKQHWEKTKKIRQIWAEEMHELGIEVIAKMLLQEMQKEKIEELYVTFDIDALDENYASNTGTPGELGLFPHEALGLIEIIRQKIPVTGADLVEFAPFTFPDLSPKAQVPLSTTARQQLNLQVAASIAAHLIEAWGPPQGISNMAIFAFPPVESASREGLLAVGGDLEVPSLIMAYSQGIFPWPIPPQIPLAWFSPNPRGILAFENLHISRDLKKKLAKIPLCLKFNQDFPRVIMECALSPHRFDADGTRASTWITSEMQKAYTDLFKHGHAFCVEAFTLNQQLAAGLYGVCFGKYVSCESMFFHISGSSKILLLRLLEFLHSQGVDWVDIQMVTPTTELMGGHYVSRSDFIRELNIAKQKPAILWPKEIISGKELPFQR